MARIILSTVGTLGDLLPFLGLGRALQGRGHDVVVAANPAQEPLVRNASLPFTRCGPPFGRDEARRLVVADLLSAAARTGRRLVVQAGWADVEPGGPAEFGRHDPERVWFVPFVAHAWLFPHAAAVIHHGSIGVTAQALRQGCPMLVLPRRKDQIFHASLIRALGVGSAFAPARLSVEGIARTLDERVCTTSTLNRSRAIAESIRAEERVVAACRRIDSFLGAPAADSHSLN